MSSTSSSLTSVLSALGGSTGIDVTAAVDAILYADRAPERGWQSQQATLQAQNNAINQLETESAAVSDSLNDLQDIEGPLSSIGVTSSNSSLLTASATAGTAASNHTVTINNLATTGSWYSTSEASSSTQLASGSFDITVGGTTTAIQIGSGNNTLAELETSINSQSLGVTASIVSTGNGVSLSLVSTASGTAGDVSITNDTSSLFTRSSTGKDASLTVDGVPVTSSTNTVTGAINGVTLNLLGASTGTPISLSLAPDSSAITTALTTFVNAYNTLISDVNTQISYNTSTQTAGILQSDSAAQGLQSALLAATNYSSGSSTYSTLTSLGITTNDDGTLSIDSTTLANTIQSNPSALTNFFQGSAFNGFSSSLSASLDSYSDPSGGAFTVDLQSISNEYQDLTDETNSLEVYLSSQQTLLTSEYNTADIAIQQLPEKLKQIQALLNPNSSSS